ncbi:lysophospholipid acyltransferase family protein [Goodfellowiella coeruleoviolacea]|uniref:1-acyl-sn-glycerol-3-phosphate acyltransferase n=1 Tax=Goodfellowiella coeruleoviolacea TaxID=334858 RepID=A0AAE3KFT0_9PSEU|nr:lysophospholipid acyltransferase family protein [Goodfellowiella coeruleoviolacea]MCP2165290.1 1-acyl-sn-glycerol-3-phosphate acyltransferase (EC 2.3.1.51) [Goodfellowiella coeruleoviolacea]
MFHGILKKGVAPVARAVYRPKVEGLDNLPAHGPVILASNHLSFADQLVISIVVPRKVSFLAKAEYFEGTGVRGALSRWFFSSLGHIPVRRGSGRTARDSLDTAAQVLAEGGIYAIFPEGTRSLDGRLHRGRTGVARTALETGAPVIPVGLIGTDKVQPVGKKLPRVKPVTVRFGAPLSFTRYQNMTATQPILRAITDEIMYAILELSGQEYVDNYQQSGNQAA